MLDTIKHWLHRYLSDSEAFVLLIILTLSLLIISTIGQMLTPIFVSLVLAFLLQSIVAKLNSIGLNNKASVWIVFTSFLSVMILSLIMVPPIIWRQIRTLIQESPQMISYVQQLIQELPNHFPHIISKTDVASITSFLNQLVHFAGKWALSFSLTNLTNIIAIIVYLILVPMLIFFFLKDKNTLINWVKQQMPVKRKALKQITDEMHIQIGNYIHGKAIEIFLVGISSFILFSWMDLQYSSLLAIVVGLSVIIPYIGATIVTIPIIAIALFQWGLSSDFYILITIYFIIQILDGNVLVPFLFSEAVNLHPVVIIISILLFGGIWGFWGIFFAIPLATLCKAIGNAWPKSN